LGQPIKTDFPKPKTLSLFSTCLADLFYPQVRHSTKSLLKSLGYEVLVPKDQTCCGQPAFNSGKWPQAKAVADQWIKSFKDAECIVIPSGSCAAMVRVNMEHLYSDEPEKADMVKKLAGKTFELVEFLTFVHQDPSLGKKISGPTAAYHYSCHQRELGLTTETETLLANAPGMSCVKLKGQEECCGFGGTFSVRMPEISAAMLKKKLDHIAEAKSNGADCVVSNDLGCLMNMQTAAQKAGMRMEFKHVVELFSEVPKTLAPGGEGRVRGNP
jgi:L-lactate dehydrogenase complex protein LldE